MPSGVNMDFHKLYYFIIYVTYIDFRVYKIIFTLKFLTKLYYFYTVIVTFLIVMTNNLEKK